MPFVTLAVGIFAMFFVYEFKSATALAYQHPDVPIEMATYVQTSPDVTRTVKELNDYSNYATGGTNLKVIYDSFTSWPFEWYLADYKNKQFIGDGALPVDFNPPPPVMLPRVCQAQQRSQAERLRSAAIRDALVVPGGNVQTELHTGVGLP